MQTYSDILSAYLAEAGETQGEFAARVETTQASINRYRKGERFPNAEMARLIDQATQGAVPFAVWQAEFMAKSGLAA